MAVGGLGMKGIGGMNLGGFSTGGLGSMDSPGRLATGLLFHCKAAGGAIWEPELCSVWV